MPRGGRRPGAGRPKGSKNKKPGKIAPKITKITKNDKNVNKIKEILGYSTIAKAKIYQDLITRVSKNERLTATEANLMSRLEKELGEQIDENEKERKPEIPDDIKAEAKAANLTPLEYMLQVMNDEDADDSRRDKMAITAAPYVHGNPAAKPSKKQERDERASKAGKGRFSPAAPPSLKAVK